MGLLGRWPGGTRGAAYTALAVAFGFCKTDFVTSPNTAEPGKGLAVLKALWGGHTAALQFAICISAQGCRFGKKNAIRTGRLQEDGIIMTCLRRILQMLIALRICVI